MQAPNNEEICKLVGIPFAYGGRDLAAFDCYGLLVYLHAQQGIKIQDYVSMQDRATISATMLGGACLWEEIEQTSGAMVAFKVAGLVSHCGLVIDDDKFIHTWERSGGVTVEKLSDWSKRIYGFYKYAA